MSCLGLGEYLRSEASKIPEIVEGSLTWATKLKPPLRGLAFGAGDSYVVAEVAQLGSNHRITALDPYEALIFPPPQPEVCVGISVKGRTREVVEALKKFRDVGCLTVAVTNDPSSPAGKAAEEVLRIPYGGGPFPVGVGNFASAAALTASAVGLSVNPSKIRLRVGENDELSDFLKESVVLVGTGWSRLAAEFISLKLAEVFCVSARVYPSEQFLHAPIYTVKEGVKAVVFGSDERSLKVHHVLRRGGVEAYLLAVPQSFEGMLSAIAAGVEALATAAISEGVREPCFLTRQAFLKESTPLIYGSGK